MTGPNLLVLAAGMGSRYGGLKQIDPVGPWGETLLDYGVYDALRAGFGRVVFVIRKDFEGLFREAVGRRYEGRVPVAYVFQSPEDVPAGPAAPSGRTKPWGTGQAVWCARDAVRDPFAVINADDFYGAASFVALARFLNAAADHPACFSLVGFRLAQTLSEHGPVSRGICRVEGSRLRSVVERTAITPDQVGPGRAYSGEEVASMNCWGFTPAVFPLLEQGFRRFLPGAGPQDEFYLPAAISAAVASGAAEVEVLPTPSSWFGVTYREDRPRVAAAIARLVRDGAYPAPLFP